MNNIQLYIISNPYKLGHDMLMESTLGLLSKETHIPTDKQQILLEYMKIMDTNMKQPNKEKYENLIDHHYPSNQIFANKNIAIQTM